MSTKTILHTSFEVRDAFGGAVPNVLYSTAEFKLNELGYTTTPETFYRALRETLQP